MRLDHRSHRRKSRAQARTVAQSRDHPRSEDKVSLIRPGNFEDDLGALAECDWIIEAIVESLEPKRELWRKVETIRDRRIKYLSSARATSRMISARSLNAIGSSKPSSKVSSPSANCGAKSRPS